MTVPPTPVTALYVPRGVVQVHRSGGDVPGERWPTRPTPTAVTSSELVPHTLRRLFPPGAVDSIEPLRYTMPSRSTTKRSSGEAPHTSKYSLPVGAATF